MYLAGIHVWRVCHTRTKKVSDQNPQSKKFYSKQPQKKPSMCSISRL
jgi:hypothetical protein